MKKTDEVCPRCNGRGIIIIDSNTAVPCSCMIHKKLEVKFKNSKMSREMMKCSFSRFNMSYYSQNSTDPVNGRTFYENALLAFNAAKKFSQDVKNNLHTDGMLLMGPVGSGKTFLACAIANSLIDKGLEVLFVVVPDLLDQLRATYDNSNQQYSEYDLLETARSVEVLVLDDLGAHNYTDWTRNKLYSIINYRENNSLPTIITTNLDFLELEEYIGERATSRIIKMCKVYRLLVETDIRILKRHEKDRFIHEKI